MSRVVPALALASIAAAILAGCGPSYQTLYEGDSHFERCYALDERADVTLEQKTGCWTNYVEHHAYGQTRDRIRYAGMRAHALSKLPTLPTDEAMMEAAPGGTSATVTAPAPTSAFAPPPKTLTDRAARAIDAVEPKREVATAKTGEPPAAPTPAPPQSSCADACGRTWGQCQATACRSAATPTSGADPRVGLAAPRPDGPHGPNGPDRSNARSTSPPGVFPNTVPSSAPM